MGRKSKIALGAGGLVAAGAVAWVMVMGIPAADPVLADLAIGKPAPAFRTADASGRPVALADYAGKTVVLEWNNPQCPTVKDAYKSGTVQKMQAAAAADGVVWLTVNSSGPWRQGHVDGDGAREYVAEQGARPAAYLLDPEGQVGRSYGARATPHIFVVNKAGALVYRGGIDGPAPEAAGAEKGRNHVMAALAELKAGKPVSVPTSRAYGCSVKYAG